MRDKAARRCAGISLGSGHGEGAHEREKCKVRVEIWMDLSRHCPREPALVSVAEMRAAFELEEPGSKAQRSGLHGRRFAETAAQKYNASTYREESKFPPAQL